MIKHLKYLLFFLLFTFCDALEKETYSISVCTTSSEEDANRCKEDILKTSKFEVFILKNQNETYSTYLGVFITYDEAKEILNNSSPFIKKQKPFIKKFEKNKENGINSNIQENIKMVEVEEKIRKVDEEIKKLDQKIIDMRMEKEKALFEEQRKKANDESVKLKEEKEKALVEFQRMEKEKALFEEQRKKANDESVKLKEEKEKALVEFQRMEKEKALFEEQRKKANDESVKLKEEKEKALVEFQRMEKEKALFEEQRKKANDESVKLKEEKEKALVEFQRMEKEKALFEEQRKKANDESVKLKEEKEKALVEFQRMEKEKALFEEQRKKANDESVKLKEEKEKALVEFQRMEKEKALFEEQRKKANDESVKLKEEKVLSSELDNLNNLDNFEKLLIKVDSVKNIMFLKGKSSNGEIIDIKTYKVSTAKTTVKKPLGEGFITSISLNPQWNPTNKTLKAFKEKGINLPSVVPFGDKLNYMGAAKINLSHKVDGQEVYRIHGTLSENTIGTNESSGCIRMKNKEIIELATLLEKFSKTKSFNNINVILE